MDSKIVSRIWWSLALRGLLAVVFGIFAFVFTGQTMLALVYVFGVFATLTGVMSLTAAVRAGEAHQRWAMLALSGVLSISSGVIAFIWPGATALAVVLLIAFWAITTGTMEVAFALAQPSGLPHRGLAVFSGVLSVIFGILLAAWPPAGVVTLTWLVGIYAVSHGATLLYYAYRLQTLRHGVQSLRKFGQRAIAEGATA